MTVLHIITGLNTGGAESMLARLVAHEGLRREGTRHEVLSLLPYGPVANRLRANDVPIHTLGMNRGVPGPVAVARLAGLMRRIRPSVVQGWMYHGNLAAAAGQFSVGNRPPMLWNIRHSISNLDNEPPMTRHVIRAGARLSSRPATIIYNSRAAAAQHEALGYNVDRMCIIGNGFDCNLLAPQPGAGQKLRKLFGIRGKSTVVAMVARAHPMKTPEVLVEAVIRARARGHDLHLLMVGKGMDSPKGLAARLIAENLAPEHVTLSDERHDVPEWLPGVDILAVPSSWGEGFPNILGEAMACGVACVSTDVGDSAYVLERSGLIVPPGDAVELAHALERLDRLGPSGRMMLGRAARARAVANFSIDNVADQYAALYERHFERAPRAEPERRLRVVGGHQ
jgi:glycosyltransferase involved in cell wall biosynthesis